MTVSGIDVFSPQFERSIVVSSDSDLWLLSSFLSRLTATSITVNNNCGNSVSLLSLDFTSLSLLKQITIGDNCFVNVRIVELSGLQHLRNVMVGLNSFKSSNSGGLYMKGCSSLKSVVIGANSFMSYSLLKYSGIPLLEELRIGDDCFKNVNELQLNGLSNLKSVVIGSNSFSNKSGSLSVTSCSSLKLLRIGSSSMVDYSVLSVDNTPSLEVIEIGSDAFAKVDELILNGLSNLTSVEIGMNSFTKSKNGYLYYSYRHFYLKNCPKLKSLKMDRYSFSDYAVCEIESVDALEVIEMGMVYGESYNFYYASLELKSIVIHSK